MTGKGILEKLRQAKEDKALPDDEKAERLERLKASKERRWDSDRPQYQDRRSLHFLDFDGAVGIVNGTASPIEYLVSQNEMENGADLEGMGGVRFHTALRLRDLLEGAQVKTLRSPALEPSIGGTGGNPTDVRSYQLDCMRILKRVRAATPEDWIFPFVQSVVWHDDWFDLGPAKPARTKKAREARRKERLKTIAALHFGLDCISLERGYITGEEFTQRWPDGVPAVPPAVRRRKQGSTAPGRLALQT